MVRAETQRQGTPPARRAAGGAHRVFFAGSAWHPALHPERVEYTSVGQRPTLGAHSKIKAVGLAHFSGHVARLFAMCKAFSLDSVARRDVGRCPTLVCVRLSA